MIRFEPEPTPELRAARQAVILAFFLRGFEALQQLAIARAHRTRLKVWTER